MVDVYTELFNDKIDHYEGIIRRVLTIRKFYYDEIDAFQLPRKYVFINL